MNNGNAINLIGQRTVVLPSFYYAQLKEIINNLGKNNIKYRSYKFLDFNVEFGITIMKEFLSYLDVNYMNIFKDMLKENLVIISKDKNNREKSKYSENLVKSMLTNNNGSDKFKSYSININCHSLESMLHLLSHEVGNAISLHSSRKFPLERNLATETISQLFPLLLSDFLKEKYPTISVFNKDKENFSLLMASLEEIEDFRVSIVRNGYSHSKTITSFDDSESNDKKVSNTYSYFLANTLYENYKETNSLGQINKLMTLSDDSYEIDYLLREINVKKGSVGARETIRKIKRRLKN